MYSYIFIGIMLLLAAASCEGLRCYSCFGTGGKNKCEDYKTYEDAMTNNITDLKKNCTGPHDQICFIETYAILGQTVSHIRDCNDGDTFSFNASNLNVRGRYDRLNELEINNETSCVWDGQHLVCLTKCDTDFCNGPVLDEVTSGYDVVKMAPMICLIVQIVAMLMRSLHIVS